MSLVTLDKRLSVIAGLVRRDGTAADIGTDHGMLACYLAQTGQEKVIASDINEMPLEAARATLAEYGVKSVELLLSDGLCGIPYADDVIIAGMGGELISAILAKCAFLSDNTRFILQPMTRHEVLRRELYRMGFEILSETAVTVRGKYYTVIHACYTGVKTEVSDYFAFVGKCTDTAYIKSVLRRLVKMEKGDSAYGEIIAEIRRNFEV